MEGKRFVKARRTGWVSWVLLTLFCIGIPCSVRADISDILLNFYPYITAQEQYSSNILLSPNATKLADYITIVNVGLRFHRLRPGTHGIDLDVNGGYTYYKKNNEFSYWNAAGRLNTWYAVTPRLVFRLRDFVIRSDAAREYLYDSSRLYDAQGQYIGDIQPDQYLLSTERGVHAIYLRNVVEPSLTYRFGSENLFSLLYRNNIYRNENPLYEDSMENTLNPRLVYWFDINNGASLDYYFRWNTFQRSPDQFTNAIIPRYTYRFSPGTSIFGQYRFEHVDFKSPGVDYYVHNPSLGIQYRFSPTLTALAQGGYFLQIPKEGSNTGGPFVILSLTQRTPRTFYILSIRSGYSEDYVTAENRGFVKTYSGYAAMRHLLTQRLAIGLAGSVGRNEFSNDQKDWVWTTRVGASYLLFRGLSVALEGSYRGSNSNFAGLGYTEYRGIFRVTLARPGYQPDILMGGPMGTGMIF